jgi:hypothetical protein
MPILRSLNGPASYCFVNRIHLMRHTSKPSQSNAGVGRTAYPSRFNRWLDDGYTPAAGIHRRAPKSAGSPRAGAWARAGLRSSAWSRACGADAHRSAPCRAKHGQAQPAIAADIVYPGERCKSGRCHRTLRRVWAAASVAADILLMGSLPSGAMVSTGHVAGASNGPLAMSNDALVSPRG